MRIEIELAGAGEKEILARIVEETACKLRAQLTADVESLSVELGLGAIATEVSAQVKPIIERALASDMGQGISLETMVMNRVQRMIEERAVSATEGIFREIAERGRR